MFADQKKGKSMGDGYALQNKIASGTTIIGDIESEGDFRIDGVIKGNFSLTGKVVIGKSGVIEGTLKASNADIEGKVSGKIYVSDILSLRASSVIDGEVETGKLSVEPGASFNATCKMKGAIKLNHDQTGSSEEKIA